ncbi:MAG: hypothetical protein AVDCRST_MAG07-2429, partial [uncultured Frankineae bacterium]
DDFHGHQGLPRHCHVHRLRPGGRTRLLRRPPGLGGAGRPALRPRGRAPLARGRARRLGGAARAQPADGRYARRRRDRRRGRRRARRARPADRRGRHRPGPRADADAGCAADVRAARPGRQQRVGRGRGGV